ncbi:hypothetical protein [Shinella sp.]|uniref:hypothetical protein n=1 Tax=Shinella sp. TaxID=1870904 RepID=UPI003D2A1E34
MALATDLMGVGMPQQQASLVGTQVISVNAAGTTQGGATGLTAATDGNVDYIVTPASSQQGVRLPTNAPIGTVVSIYPTAGTPLITIYPASGQTLNILSADTGIAMTSANKNAVVKRVSQTNWRVFFSGAA